jgi:hypothetical protein
MRHSLADNSTSRDEEHDASGWLRPLRVEPVKRVLMTFGQGSPETAH